MELMHSSTKASPVWVRVPSVVSEATMHGTLREMGVRERRVVRGTKAEVRLDRTRHGVGRKVDGTKAIVGWVGDVDGL